MRFGTGTSDQRIKVQLIYNALCPSAWLPFSVIQFHSPLCHRRFSLYTMVKFPGTNRHPFGTDTTGQAVEVQLIWYSLCAAAVYGTVSSAIMLYHNKQFSLYTMIKFPEFTRSSVLNDWPDNRGRTYCMLCAAAVLSGIISSALMPQQAVLAVYNYQVSWGLLSSVLILARLTR